MSSDNNEARQVQIAVADPTPLGLFGLSVVTFVASMQKLGVVSDVSWVIPWALVCGSFAQLLAAYFDFCHKYFRCGAGSGGRPQGAGLCLSGVLYVCVHRHYCRSGSQHIFICGYAPD